MIIEVWSDVVCPWCYIGKRRLESALAEFPHEVEVVWRSFQLDPGAPRGADRDGRGEPRPQVRRRPRGRRPDDRPRRGGGGRGGPGLPARTSAQRANTVDAHRLLHLALEQGGPALQGAVKEALLAAYFTDARNVADHAELRDVAVGAGVDAGARWTRCWPPRSTADEVYADIEQAQAYGATGVPFFVIDRKYGVSGAQPADTFRQVLDRAWSDAHPTLEVVGAGDACGPDGCAV